MERTGSTIFILLNVVFGIYLLNFGFNFLEVPRYISDFNNVILTLSGIFIIFGVINYVRIPKRRH